uniref:Uncharacterized protein n=1 Tax=Rhizophora mucronata TaxID=61149 RepID=A0A2P2PNA2_RHIMU
MQREQVQFLQTCYQIGPQICKCNSMPDMQSMR